MRPPLRPEKFLALCAKLDSDSSLLTMDQVGQALADFGFPAIVAEPVSKLIEALVSGASKGSFERADFLAVVGI